MEICLKILGPKSAASGAVSIDSSAKSVIGGSVSRASELLKLNQQLVEL